MVLQESRLRQAARDEPSLGPEQARVNVVEFADFQCPHCRDLERGDSMQRVRELAREGKVRLTFIPFPVMGSDSWLAAEVAHAVWRQAPGSYWDWHDSTFERQAQPQSGWASTPNLLEHASRFQDLDTGALSETLRDAAFRDHVESDKEEGRRLGVRGTPTLFVNAEQVAPEDLLPAVERALSGE